MNWQLAVSIFGPIVTLLIAVISLLYNKKNQLERQLDGEKRAVFEDFTNALVNTMASANVDNPKLKKRHEEELNTQMKKIKKNLILYAAPKTIRAHNKWMLNQSTNPSAESNFKDIERLVRAFRKEIGLSNLFLREYQILQIIVKDDIAKGLKELESVQAAQEE